MSDALVEVSAGDTKEDQSDSLNVETAQPSLLKKGGLFGQSVAMSPKASQATPSPAEKSSENGNEEVSSQHKNGGEADSNANGDHKDEGVVDLTNGDSTDEAQDDDDVVMAIEESAADDEEEEEKPADQQTPAEPAAADAAEEADEHAAAQPVRAVDVIEDIEMEDDAEEEDEAANKDDVAAAEEKEDAAADGDTGEEEKNEDTTEEKEKVEPEGDDVEEECVKKVISMDTDEIEEPAEEKKEEEAEKAEDSALDVTQDEKEEEEEKEVVATPAKRGRGRPPKSASGTPVTVKKTPSASKTAAAVTDEEGEETSSSKRTPRGAAKKAAEALASPTSAKGRGRRSIKSDTSSQPDADEEEKKKEGEETEEGEEQEAKTPAAGRGRRSIRTPATATRVSGRGKKAEKEEAAVKEDEEEEKAESEKKTPRRGRGSIRSTPSVKKETSSAKKQKKEDDEEESTQSSVSPSRRSTRGSPTKTPSQATPKGRGRKSSVKSEDTMETAVEDDDETIEEEEEEEKGTKKSRGMARKSVPKKKKKTAADESEGAADPFDMDTELDKHPEPLRNITVEKGSFGEMKYTRSPAASKSKYAATERSAIDKVANLPNTPAATGTPKTIASVQSARKSLGGSPVKRTPASRKKKGSEGVDEEEMDEDELIEEAAMETPKEKKSPGRGRPPGSSGRKRKADDTPTAAPSAKRSAVSVTIPSLDAEKQWAADHPEDDSAPLVPGARVFAVFQKVFYPALVGERDGLGRYMVEFVEDKIVRPVPPAGVVPLSAVTIDKECLYQSSPDDDPILCRVLKSANAANAKEWQEGDFKLMEMGTDETEHDAKWTMLQLDMATTEWKKYVNAKSKMVTRINTDNITSLEDRRERRSRVHNDTAVAIAAYSGTPEPTARRSVGKKTPATATTTPAVKTPGSGRRGRKPKALVEAEAEAAAAEEDEEKVEEQEKEQNGEEEGEKMETDEKPEEKKKPEMNPRIFLNKTFILTSANRTVSEVVFKKNEMKKQILERGGVVVEDINQVPLDAEAYLISDTHYRTHKYLAAMSRGMPCLSHMWLVECVKKESLEPYDKFKLAGGQGLLNGELYPLPDVRGKLLVGRTIMVHSKTDSSMKKGTMGFKQIWSPIVELLGSRVVSDACLTNITSEQLATLELPDQFEILLTDSSCPPEIVHKLESMGKAVVSSEWLIQSIIMGACPDFGAHPRFRYDSGNEPTKKEGSQEQAQS